MKVRTRHNTLTLFMMLALLLASLSGLSSLPDRGATPGAAPAGTGLLPELFPAPVHSDFDNDNQPDQAELLSNSTIRITFGNSLIRHLSSGSDQLSQGRLIASDIDNDDDQDLVWIARDKLIAPMIWLGDGHGQFVKADHPEDYDLANRFVPAGNNHAKFADSQENDNLSGDSLAKYLAGLPGKAQTSFAFTRQLRQFSFSHHIGISQCLTHLSKRGPPTAHTR